MTAVQRLSEAGTSQEAIRHHYDLPDDFYRLWLGEELVYSCAWWAEGEAPDALTRPQWRKLDFFATRLHVEGARVLDVGCGWGALVDRFVRVDGAKAAVGITVSPAQASYAAKRGAPGVEVRHESWVDHQPEAPYDAITCVEATEHFASDRLTADDKVAVYQEFFRRTASWLRPGGRLGLQVICLDNAAGGAARQGAGPVTDLIRDEIFRDSMSPSLSQMVLGWESDFELDEFHDHTEHYRRTFRAWALRYRRHRAAAEALVGRDTARAFGAYFAAGEAIFRLREQALFRVVLNRRAQPKHWVVPVRPSALATATPAPAASAPAVRSHYDLSNDFFRLWLGPSMSYSSAMWAADEDGSDLETAHHRKIDFFGRHVVTGGGHRLLDVGCGWGEALRRLVGQGQVDRAVGLTVSERQKEYLDAHPVPGVEVRLEGWAEHQPREPYDAIISFGAFEHFARDGSSGPERIAAYRRFFERCHAWLVPDGRLGLETIAQDAAPDTAQPLGRGPLGDVVLELFPESLCPHLQEIVLGCEPWFSVQVLRSDPGDFARTFRAWLLELRAHEEEAARLVGADVARRFRRYLASSEVQFRVRAITNYRLVLHRRPVALVEGLRP